MATRIGEVEVEITDDIKTTDDLKTLLRINWGAETTGKAEFKPSQDLKSGDKVKVTIEKL